MLAIYSRDDRARKKVEMAVPHRQVWTAAGWTAFEALVADGAQCSVVAIPLLASDPDVPRLTALRARFPLHPVVLVTRGEIGNARNLAGLLVEAVVWLEEVERELSGTVGRTCVLAEARCFATALRAAPLPAALRGALARVASAESPVCTVAALAETAGCDRRTLWSQWRQSPLAGELRLQDFLHWLILLRAAGAKTRDRPWSAVAEDLGVHPHTLARLARQLVGLSLREVAEAQCVVAERFREQVLEKLEPAS